jgi:hypothetical protein
LQGIGCRLVDEKEEVLPGVNKLKILAFNIYTIDPLHLNLPQLKFTSAATVQGSDTTMLLIAS